MNRTVLILTVLSTVYGQRRFSVLLKGASSLQPDPRGADPYSWELQENPVSRNSCYSFSATSDSASSALTVRDASCVGFADDSSKCHGGFPFYRFGTSSPECADCMDARQCQMLCLSKGMDAAALVLDSRSRNPTECRCGATKKNLPIWRLLLTASPKDGQINFGPVHSLLPVSVNSAISANDANCGMYVFLYKDVRESDGGVPKQFVELTVDDERYIRSIVSGLADPIDVEDSTAEEGGVVHEAVRRRLELWLKKNPTNRVPQDEVLTNQVPYELSLKNLKEKVVRNVKKAGTFSSTSSCAGIDEPTSCWDNAVASVLSINKVAQLTPDQSAYTAEYSNMMMTITMDQWQGLFNTLGTPYANVTYTGSNFCQYQAGQCPITCGQCELYDRAPRSAAAYNTWIDSKDATTGQVTIPVVFNSSNMYVTPQLQALVVNATNVLGAAVGGCINFSIVDESSLSRSNPNYVVITADTVNGVPSGCLADPVGLPDTPPTRINVGGCLENANPLGSIVHEFLHVLGLVHTQMRPDRDNYIRMNPPVVSSPFQVNFFLSPYAFDGADGTYSPYDYGSIMHYTQGQAGNATFYNAHRDQYHGTFELLNPLSAGVTIGQRSAMSALDIAEVSKLYQCGAAGTGNNGSGQSVSGNSTIPTQTPTPTPTPTPLPSNATVPSNITANVPSNVPSNSTSNTTSTSPSTLSITTISEALSSIAGSSNITLSVNQTEAIDHIQSTVSTLQQIYVEFNNQNATAVPSTSDWEELISSIASDCAACIAESRSAIASFDAGQNPNQVGILDEEAIANIATILSSAQNILIQFRSMENHQQTTLFLRKAPIMAHHPSVKRSVVVFGSK